jgi:hypothetical protein
VAIFGWGKELASQLTTLQALSYQSGAEDKDGSISIDRMRMRANNRIRRPLPSRKISTKDKDRTSEGKEWATVIGQASANCSGGSRKPTSQTAQKVILFHHNYLHLLTYTKTLGAGLYKLTVYLSS